MIAFRDRRAAETGVELHVWTNPDGVAQGISPISHGATVHNDVMKTQALKQALDRWGFDAAIGEARRAEEKSPAQERLFSLRAYAPRRDVTNPRHAPWSLSHTPHHQGDTDTPVPTPHSNT